MTADDYEVAEEQAMIELEQALADAELAPPTLAGADGKAPCRHPRRLRFTDPFGRWCQCGYQYDATNVRRGKQSRNYGNRAELKVANKYGGTKIGAAGGPVDVRGKDWNVQVKTHRRLPPAEWRKAFQGMAASGERHPRLLLRFLPGPGLPPDDYMVIPGNVWLDWFGKDE